MTDDLEHEIEIAKSLSDPNHPIWKIMLALTAILSAMWINGSV